LSWQIAGEGMCFFAKSPAIGIPIQEPFNSPTLISGPDRFIW
jgi:hypothetical protein